MRGGARQGAGRKANPLKTLHAGAETAERILQQLGHEKEIAEIYKECGDWRLKAHILFRLREWAYGRPPQPQEHNLRTDEPLAITIISHIPRPVRGKTAKPASKHQ